jgi:TrmH family RNA methyltransferase
LTRPARLAPTAATGLVAERVSARHPSVQRLRRLSGRRSARSDEGAYVIDGPTLLAEALAAGVAIHEVVAEPSCPDDLLERAAAARATVRRVDAGVLARVTDTVTPQPAAAIATLALVLVGVGDPGNAGTLLRSAEGAGAGAVVFCDGSVDPYAPKCVRASAGSVFRLVVVRDARSSDALRHLTAAGVATVGTLARGAPPYDEADLARPVALVLGSEAHGLSDGVAGQVERTVTIPMAGRTESLNVGMAGTILCFESLRQRRAVAQRRDQRNELDATPPEAAGCSEP